MSNQPSAILRTGWGWYAAFSGLALFMLILGINAGLRSSSFWLPNAIAELFPICMLIWFKTTVLRIDDHMLHYRSLFGNADIPIRNVLSARVMVGFSGYDPYIRLVVRAREKDSERTYILNLTLFTRDDIYKWLDVFRKHFPALEA